MEDYKAKREKIVQMGGPKAMAQQHERRSLTARERIAEFRELFENPYCAAERGYVDDVIMPSDTRKHINRALDFLENKTDVRPLRKYSNINL